MKTSMPELERLPSHQNLTTIYSLGTSLGDRLVERNLKLFTLARVSSPNLAASSVESCLKHCSASSISDFRATYKHVRSMSSIFLTSKSSNVFCFGHSLHISSNSRRLIELTDE